MLFIELDITGNARRAANMLGNETRLLFQNDLRIDIDTDGNNISHKPMPSYVYLNIPVILGSPI